MSRKICVVTGARAEYGLLRWVMEGILETERLELQVVATGMHLSPEFGLTYKEIEKDGFHIDRKVEMLLSSDTPVGLAKSMGLGLIGFGEALPQLQPDLMLVLGDRFEIFSAVSAALVARIPVAHLHGGESTEGAFDEAIRHSITKMSHLHFVAAEEYRKRVIQLGEHPDRVFNVGALGVDSVQRLQLMPKRELENAIGFKFGQRNFLVTFHPVTLENATVKKQFLALLAALSKLEDAHFIFTKANADTDGRIINQMIDEYVEKSPQRAAAYISLGQQRYLSAMQCVDGVIGNSSSGLIEAPALKIGSVNIGDRQRGRIKADSTIDCAPNESSISEALEKLSSQEFKDNLKSVSNPFGEGGTAKKIIEGIKSVDLEGLIKKSFYQPIESGLGK